MSVMKYARKKKKRERRKKNGGDKFSKARERKMGKKEKEEGNIAQTERKVKYINRNKKKKERKSKRKKDKFAEIRKGIRKRKKER